MSRKDFQIKKSVPFKVKGSSRNPFGDYVIINREEHYGTKDQHLVRRIPSDSGPDQPQQLGNNRKQRKGELDVVERGFSQKHYTASNNERAGKKISSL